MAKKLLIFIDGLNYNVAMEHFPLVAEGKCIPVRPGIGFSNNIYPEMLCGLTPDDIGYFNEWSPSGLKVRKRILRILDIFRSYPYINAGIRKIIMRKLFRLDFANIPFRYTGLFLPQGSHKFSDLPKTSILHEYDYSIKDAIDSGKKRRERDFKILNDLEVNLENENTFISLLDLDHTSHVFGTRSKEVIEHLHEVSEKLSKIVSRFTEFDELNEVYLFSDHGMVDVEKEIDFKIEDVFGFMSPSTYLYFVDSTYVRIWIYDESLREEMKIWLDKQDYGKLVEADERAEFGLTNPDFGHLVFRLNEGNMFVPNFYGGRVNKAMHGYSPDLDSQQAIFWSNKEVNNYPLPKTSQEIYSFLKICHEG